ncbi:hypothetical protein [Streptomyces sp. NPDC059816]|uniref:hypothetical protein n=1 Tax=Streptomyces sp. NPDC059816 TaxID=3346960 RepID=UPI003651D95C
MNRRQLLGTAASLGLPPSGDSSRRRPLNPAVVAHLRGLRATLVQSDSLYGPHCVIGAVRDHLAVIEEQVLSSASGNLRAGVLRTASEWAEFAGWLHEDLGQPEVGLWWSDRAMEWAQEADDPALQAFVLMRKAQQSVGLNQRQRAIGLASAALLVRGDVPERVRASAHIQRAHGHALAGDGTEAARAIATAHELAAGTRATRADQLGGYCVPAYVEAQRAACQLLLGHPAEAVASYQRALDHWPGSYQRERGLHLARLATAHAAARSPDAACVTALEALEIMRETDSRRTTAELRRVVTALTPWRTTSAVRGLVEAVAAI